MAVVGSLFLLASAAHAQVGEDSGAPAEEGEGEGEDSGAPPEEGEDSGAPADGGEDPGTPTDEGEDPGTPTDEGVEALALRAQEVHERSCPEVAARSTTVAAQEARFVVAAWADLSEAYETDRQPWVLYWRGMLAICLGQVDRGTADLFEFIDVSQGDPNLAALVKEARRRIVRLDSQSAIAPPREAVPGLVVGVGLAALAGGAAVGVGAIDAPLAQVRALVTGGGNDAAVLDAALAEGDRLYGAQIALVCSVAGLGAGAVAALVSAAGQNRQARLKRRRLLGSSSRGPAVGVVPTDGGATVVWVMQW